MRSTLLPLRNQAFWGLGNEFNDFFHHLETGKKDFYSSESDQGYLLGLELPGVSTESLSVEIEGQLLTVKAQRKLPFDSDIQEIEKRFRLPKEVNREQVNANLKDGFLTLELPKLEEEKPRKIEVKTSGLKTDKESVIDVQEKA